MIQEIESSVLNSWNHYLEGTQCSRLPTKWHNKDVTSLGSSPKIGRKTLTIPYAVSNEILLSAWAIVLSLFTALDDVAFGLIIESSSADLSSGKCHPFRLNVSSVDSPTAIAKSARESLHRIQDYSCNSLSDLSNLIGRGTVVCITTAASDGDQGFFNDNAEDLKVPVRVTFQCLEETTVLKIHAVQDQYDSRYLSEVLRQTSSRINSLSGNSKHPNKSDTLDLILSWTRPCEPLPQTLLLHQWVGKQVQLTPDAIAIGESERVMTYRELDEGANLLAAHLVSEHIDEGKTNNVGIFFEKSAYAVMAMLAVLKAGCTYVPLDIAWPQQRISIVLENANIRSIFCSKAQSTHLPAMDGVRVLAVDESTVYELENANSKTFESRNIVPSTAAYMLYTSGSTGIPKGISVSHRAISTSIQAMARNLHINEETRTFQYTTFTFDLNIADLWMTLSYGGRICLPSEEERLSPSEFIAQERCNYAMITPTAASMIDVTTMHDNIKTLTLIGEAVPERLLQKIATPGSSMKLYNTWGPTEACVIASRSESITCENGVTSVHPNNIGYPLGATIFLVDATNPHRLADPFLPGEIVLVGHSLAIGYHGNEDKTREAFRTDLEWTKNERLIEKTGGSDVMSTVYLTGDIGCYNPNGDGTIIFMHRKEGGYIKINGYRVDPGEIEGRILDLAAERLEEICVLGYEQSDEDLGDTRQILVCFLAVGNSKAIPGAGCTLAQASTEQKTHVKHIVESLRDTLPEYMIPRLFVPLETLPVLTSHKIDRKAMLEFLKNSRWADLVERFGT